VFEDCNVGANLVFARGQTQGLPLHLFHGRSAQRLKDNRHKRLALRALDLFEGLDILMLGTVHDTQDFGEELAFVSRPMTA